MLICAEPCAESLIGLVPDLFDRIKLGVLQPSNLFKTEGAEPTLG